MITLQECRPLGTRIILTCTQHSASGSVLGYDDTAPVRGWILQARGADPKNTSERHPS
jgi:hypothetical protein